MLEHVHNILNKKYILNFRFYCLKGIQCCSANFVRPKITAGDLSTLLFLDEYTENELGGIDYSYR